MYTDSKRYKWQSATRTTDNLVLSPFEADQLLIYHPLHNNKYPVSPTQPRLTLTANYRGWTSSSRGRSSDPVTLRDGAQQLSLIGLLGAEKACLTQSSAWVAGSGLACRLQAYSSSSREDSLLAEHGLCRRHRRSAYTAVKCGSTAGLLQQWHPNCEPSCANLSSTKGETAATPEAPPSEP